jgi:uncharacterized protein (DUF305 family)
MRLTLIRLLLLALFLGSNASAVQAQTPGATPVGPTSNEICALVDASASPVAISPIATPVDVDLASVPFDQIFIDALVPQLNASIAMATVIADRTTHPPVRDLTAILISTQSNWANSLTDRRTAWFPEAPALTDSQLLTAMAIHLSDSPGAGSPAGLDGMSAVRSAAQLQALCSAGTDADLIFIDTTVARYSGLLILAQVAIERAEHPEIAALATDLSTELQAEIDQLNLWRTTWYRNAPYVDSDGG